LDPILYEELEPGRASSPLARPLHLGEARVLDDGIFYRQHEADDGAWSEVPVGLDAGPGLAQVDYLGLEDISPLPGLAEPFSVIFGAGKRPFFQSPSSGNAVGIAFTSLLFILLPA